MKLRNRNLNKLGHKMLAQFWKLGIHTLSY